MFSAKNFCQASAQRLLTFAAAAVMLMASLSGAAAQQKLMVYGDSLVAGYGLDAGLGFPEQLQSALTAAGRDIRVLNAGVSGDTTAGGLARLDWALADRPDAIIIVLGGNDLLRGLNPAQTRDNLRAMLTRLRMQDIAVLLCGMLAPVNLGPDYRQQFDSIYPDLATEFGLELYPFFLEGVALNPRLNLLDGLHPNTQGVAAITTNILPYVTRLLDKE
ncbi:lysophospholipase L1-like esterase [SAR116 cluster alpha proteobacterium HIMB100]|nr:lysophospholipase L1-like esterase [SAR116 cluster alpha proteobacterium HIMB100]